MNAFYFPTVDSQKDSGLKIEFMLETAAACSIKNYRTFLEIAQFRQPITVARRKQKTKTYTGDIVPMFGYTNLSFSFDSDGEYQFEVRIRTTQTQASNLLGIEFCRQYVSKLHFEIPAMQQKKRQTLSVMVICVHQTPILFLQRYILLENHIRHTLKPNLQSLDTLIRR